MWHVVARTLFAFWNLFNVNDNFETITREGTSIQSTQDVRVSSPVICIREFRYLHK